MQLPLKKYTSTNTNVAGCLTFVDTHYFFATSLHVICEAKLIFFIGHFKISGHWFSSVFNKLFICVSSYDLFTASLASIAVAT